MAKYEYDRQTFYFTKDRQSAEEEKLKNVLEKLGRNKTDFVCALIKMFEGIHGVDTQALTGKELMHLAQTPSNINPAQNLLYAMMQQFQTGVQAQPPAATPSIITPEKKPLVEKGNKPAKEKLLNAVEEKSSAAEMDEFEPGQAEMLKNGLLDFGI